MKILYALLVALVCASKIQDAFQWSLNNRTKANELLSPSQNLFVSGLARQDCGFNELTSPISSTRHVQPHNDKEALLFIHRRHDICPSKPEWSSLYFALWGILEYEGYDYLTLFNKNGFELPHSYWVHRWFKLPSYLDDKKPTKSFPSMLYAFYALGQWGIPPKEGMIRQKIEDMILRAYAPSKALLSPVVLLTVGEAMMEQIAAFKHWSKPMTSMMNPYSRIMKHLQQLRKEYRGDKVLMLKAMNALKKLTKQTRLNSDRLDAIGLLALMTHIELKHVIRQQLAIYFMASVTYQLFPTKFELQTVKIQFDPHQSPFLQTLTYFARTFIRLGTEMLHSLTDAQKRALTTLDLTLLDLKMSWSVKRGLKPLTKEKFITPWSKSSHHSKSYSFDEFPGIFVSEQDALKKFVA